MSVFTNVFGRRKGIQKRLNNLTNPGRAQSPPSPASFVSPDINEKASFNPYSLYEATQSSASQLLQRNPSGQAESSKRTSSPKVHIDVPFSTDGHSLSDWFPADLLQRSDSPAPRPERNASLGIKAGAGGSALGVDGGHSRAASSSGHSHADTASHAGTGSISGLRSDASMAGSSRARQASFAEDEVIVIEAPRGRDPTLSPLRASFNQPRSPAPESVMSGPKRPLPEPLRIPDPLRIPEPGGIIIRRQRTASVVSLPGATTLGEEDDLFGGGSPPARNPSLSRTRRPSLSRSRSRLYTRSRPASTYSRYSDTEFDYDDVSSAISGTTLARELVQSYILSPASSVSGPGQFARTRGHLARQDSATLPRGELPSFFNRKSIRASVRSSKSSGTASRGNSTYWRDRRISGDQIVLVSPEDKLRQEEDVPPVPALPEGLSPEPSPFGSRSRKTSPGGESRRGSEVGLTAEWRYSNGGRRVAEPVLEAVAPERKRRRVSKIEEAGASIAGNGEVDNGDRTVDGGHETLLQHEEPAAISTPPHDIHDYETPPLSHSGSTASANSTAVHTPSSATGVHDRHHSIVRSFSDGSPRKSMGPRPAPLLSLSERPRSSTLQSPDLGQSQTQGPRSPSERPRHSFMSPLQPPIMPAASNPSPDSPDILDIMLAGSVVKRGTAANGLRVISPPAPISVPPRDLTPPTDYGFLQYDPNSPSTASAVKQTFPETPYAFTPATAGFSQPQLPPGTPPLPRTTSVAGRQTKQDMGKLALRRFYTMKSPPASQAAEALPMTPPASASDFHLAGLDVSAVPHTAGVLSAIEEASTPGSPMSAPSEYSNTPEHSPGLVRAHDNDRPASLIPAKRALTPLPSPPASAIPLPPSPLPSPAVHELSVLPPPPTSPAPSGAVQNEARSPPPSPSPSLRSVRSMGAFSTPPASKFSKALPAEGVPGRRVLMRPPPPSGPRRPSGPQSFSRSRGASVSSSVGSPPMGLSSSASYGSNAASTMSTPPASSLRFQTTPVKFRGLTMEAAHWTFTSQQLQETVSTAIKKSSHPSTIRLLPTDVLNDALPAELARLEAHSAELRTNYKLGVRKRKMLLGSLRSIADGGELADAAASARLLEDVAELSEHLDHIAADLYGVSDQLAQLRHLQDVHFGSALAVALHKLNAAVAKYSKEKETLRQQLFALELERDEAWRHAQQAAEEADDLTHKIAIAEGIVSPNGSRRSSKIIIARKASVRRAGLRSPSRLRSQRSSMASGRNSMNMSPALRSAPNGESVPPVPPIPLRMPLGISTSDLPGRGSTLTSEASPTSENRAMQQAQEEICEMLGISPEDLRAPPAETRPKRSMSLTAATSPASARSFATRSNSVLYSPKDPWRSHHRSRSIDDRTAVLASIGMASA